MSTTTQWNSNDYKLINFNVPKYLIKNFDNMVKFKRVSRTSLLIGMMESYLRTEYRRMKEDDDLNQLINDIENRNRYTKTKVVEEDRSEGWSVGKEDYYPPSIPNIPQFNDFRDEMDW